MKSVFKKSVIAGAMVIGLMVSPMSAGTALAAEDGAGVTATGVTPYFDQTPPDGGGDVKMIGPYPYWDLCRDAINRGGYRQVVVDCFYSLPNLGYFAIVLP